MTTKTFSISDCQIVKPQLGGNKIVVVVRCPISDMSQAAGAIRVLSSIELKDSVYANRADLGLADYGIERHGSTHPYTAKPTELGARAANADIKGYEAEFRFTRNA